MTSRYDVPRGSECVVLFSSLLQAGASPIYCDDVLARTFIDPQTSTLCTLSATSSRFWCPVPDWQSFLSIGERTASDGAALHNIWHGFVTVRTFVPLTSTKEEVWRDGRRAWLASEAPPAVEIWDTGEQNQEGSGIPPGSLLALCGNLSWQCPL